jgi:hypothetical protein
MKGLGSNSKKILAAFAVSVGLILLIFLNLLERKKLDQINNSFSSIYNDRLIPATDIFYIMENLYSNRLGMEKYMLSEIKHQELFFRNFSENRKSIDSLILQYENTYLVANEYRFLYDFKNTLLQYSKLENEMVLLVQNGSIREAHQIFEYNAALHFQKLISNLHELALIQTSEGGEIIKSFQGNLNDANIGSQLEIAVVLLIVIAVQVFLITTRKVKFPIQKFHLN